MTKSEKFQGQKKKKKKILFQRLIVTRIKIIYLCTVMKIFEICDELRTKVSNVLLR